MFTVQKTIDGGRVGKIHMRGGEEITTPFFMPDATRASVRGISNENLVSVGVSPIVVNTYHLMLQPGVDRISQLGGIHAFMGWKGAILSDSGGYQVYSLIHKNPDMGRVTEDGAEFRSVIDGTRHMLTPERAIEIQFDLGVDMMVCLDDPRPNDAPREDIEGAVDRTIRWAKRCRDAYEDQLKRRDLNGSSCPMLFGVVQGGPYKDLRKKCADGLMSIGFDGYGFGARHVDEKGVFMDEIVRYTASLLPEDALRFALGVGTPEDIVRCHAAGWDMFDCVIPTREGRHGRLFLWNKKRISNNQFPISNGNAKDFYETANITNERFKDDKSPIDESCDCVACANGYSRAYLHHLFRVSEPLGSQLATLHNLRFYVQLMQRLQGA